MPRITCDIDGNSYITSPDFMRHADPAAVASFTTQCEGKRRWAREGRYVFEATPYNANLFAEHFQFVPPQIPDVRPSVFEEHAARERVGTAVEMPAMGSRGEPAIVPAPKPGRPAFSFKTEPWTVQKNAFAKGLLQRVFALFMIMGSGKSKVAIDLCSERWCRGEIDAMLLFSPKGVHAQWIEKQFPIHCSIPYSATIWGDKNGKNGEGLEILSMNHEASITARGKQAIQDFINRWPLYAVVVDESHKIKNPSAQRTKALIALGEGANFKLILTGTPIAKNLIDLWSQFKFLDWKIIGHKYMTTFRNAFCIMGGWQGKVIVGHRNVKELYRIIEPYVYRCTKEDLGLPPKIYATRTFEMGPKQRRAFNELKSSFSTQLENGDLVSVANAAVLLTRLQQITRGRVHESKANFDRVENPALTCLMEALDEAEDEKVIIWCKFQEDVQDIMEALGDKARDYYGPTKDKDRDKNKAAFCDPNSGVQYLVGTPDAMGTGTDGLQEVCSLSMYYSNSHNAIHRWQSEDRIDRMGNSGTSRYIDIICRGGIDAGLRRNLRDKKSVSDMTLDDVRKLIEGEYDDMD